MSYGLVDSPRHPAGQTFAAHTALKVHSAQNALMSYGLVDPTGQTCVARAALIAVRWKSFAAHVALKAQYNRELSS